MEFRENEKEINNIKGLEKAKKAYDNLDFIHSRDGRLIRIISEYLYPEQYFRRYGVKGAIVVYGSARTLSMEEYEFKMKEINDKIAIQPENKSTLEQELHDLKKTRKMTETYNDCVTLTSMISEWVQTLNDNQKMLICTGGGPGMMEAANRGSSRVNSQSIGLNISLPFEQYPNKYITPQLNFEFHYFFMRKYWFVYLAKAIVAMPGGLGTLDELMEIMTLKQTLKVTKPLPIILYNEEFWRNVINFEYLLDMKMINKEDLSLFKYCNTPDEAFKFLKENIILNAPR